MGVSFSITQDRAGLVTSGESRGLMIRQSNLDKSAFVASSPYAIESYVNGSKYDVVFDAGSSAVRDNQTVASILPGNVLTEGLRFEWTQYEAPLYSAAQRQLSNFSARSHMDIVCVQGTAAVPTVRAGSVASKNRTQRIEHVCLHTIRPGDRVLTYDPSKNRMELRTVWLLLSHAYSTVSGPNNFIVEYQPNAVDRGVPHAALRLTAPHRTRFPDGTVTSGAQLWRQNDKRIRRIELTDEPQWFYQLVLDTPGLIYYFVNGLMVDAMAHNHTLLRDARPEQRAEVILNARLAHIVL